MTGHVSAKPPSARPGQRLTAALNELRKELVEINTRRKKIERAIEGLTALLSIDAEADAEPPVPVVPPCQQEEAHHLSDDIAGNGGDATNGNRRPERRPLLRDSIPQVLREHPDGLTLKELADELWRRDWVGGKTQERRLETVRQGLVALRRNGVISHEIPPGEKAARLSNVILPRAPTYSAIEENEGI